MVFYLVTKGHRYTIEPFLATVGRAIAPRVRVVPYDTVLRRRRVPLGVYIFSDFDRLTPPDLDRAAVLWHALADAGATLLNHPTRSMKRYELLRHLYEAGINSHDVYRLTEARRPRRYPVFLRREDEHTGSLSPLLAGPAELDTAVAEIERRGENRDRLLVVEFSDTADEGLFWKYSAFYVAGEVIPRSVGASQDWMVKVRTGPLSARTAIREDEMAATNPHAAQISRVFATARIDFGRIDYTMHRGRLHVWEINTNPLFPRPADPQMRPANARCAQRLVEALARLDRGRPHHERGVVRTGLTRHPVGAAGRRLVRALAARVRMQGWPGF